MTLFFYISLVMGMQIVSNCLKWCWDENFHIVSWSGPMVYESYRHEFPYRVFPGVRPPDSGVAVTFLLPAAVLFSRRAAADPALLRSVLFLNNLPTVLLPLPDICQSERSKV